MDPSQHTGRVSPPTLPLIDVDGNNGLSVSRRSSHASLQQPSQHAPALAQHPGHVDDSPVIGNAAADPPIPQDASTNSNAAANVATAHDASTNNNTAASGATAHGALANSNTVTAAHPSSRPTTANPSTTSPATSIVPQKVHSIPSRPASPVAQPVVTMPVQALSDPSRRKSLWGLIRSWTLELIACLLACLFLLAIIIIIAHYRHNLISDWQASAWSLNSVLAFFTALMEASVAFAVGACLGQLRWLWFQKDTQGRGLKWMDRLTNASRPSGAIRFFFSQGFLHWAALGAGVIIALIGSSVFIQQVVIPRDEITNLENATYPCTVPVSNAYANLSFNGLTGNTPGDQTPVVPMMASINAGFSEPASTQEDDSVADLVSCTTGNCTFGNYSSLAVCSKCADLSAFVHKNGSNFEITGHNLYLDITRGWVNITSDTNYPNNTNITDVGPLIVHYTAMSSSDTSFAVATECVAFWCVANYESNVTNNIFYENIFSNWTNTTTEATTTYGQAQDIYLNPEECWLNGTSNKQCSFFVDSLTQRALQNHLSHGTTTDKAFLKGEMLVQNINKDSWRATSLAAQVLFTPCNFGTCNGSFFEIQGTAFNSMADYMTINIRKLNFDQINYYTYGQMTLVQSHFHVRWGWVVYPCAIVLAAIIFTLVTIYRTRDDHLWKSSVTALLFHGFHDVDDEEYNDPKQMEHATETWVVRLEKASRNGKNKMAFRKMSETAAATLDEEMKNAPAQMVAHGLDGMAKAFENA